MKDSTLHQAKTLTALSDISRHISSSLDYRETASSCLVSLSENLDLEKCALLMPTPDGSYLSIHASIGWMAEEAKNLKFSIANSPAGRVFSSGMPIAVQDINDLTDLYVPDLSGRESGFTGFIAVPVMVNRIAIGVLTAYRVSNLTMLDEDVNVMKIVASILSQTLKLADLIEEKSRALKLENEKLHFELKEKYGLENVVSSSSAMGEMLAIIKRVAGTDASVLLRGESGTGKTMIARSIHYASPRRKGPLVIINCASIPESLIESELFGHEKGAFTGAVNRRVGKFEAARLGTLVLDEIGELSMEMQAKLLRVIQDGKFERVGSNETLTTDVRLICATNANLEQKIRDRLFREDLYHRLMVVPLTVPPLRERKADILPLVFHFLKHFNAKYDKHITVTREGLDVLENHSWSGNVRELENTIERAVILAETQKLEPAAIPFLDLLGGEPANSGKCSPVSPPQGESHKKRELYQRVPIREQELKKALEEAAGIQTLAARRLGVSLRQLRYAVKRFNLEVRNYKY